MFHTDTPILSHVVKTLLDAGFPVRGTVRTAAKGEYLQNLFKDSPVPFAYIVVANIETASRCVARWGGGGS